MRIIDKHIFKNVSFSYFFILLVFISFYFIIDIFTYLSDFLQTKPPLKTLIEYYILNMPLIFLRVSPLAILIGILYSFGEFNKSNEILSMRASGISLIRISLPVIFFAVFISLFSLMVQEKMLANSQKRIEEIKLRFIKKELSLTNEEKNIAFTSKDMIFFIGKFLPKQGLMQNVIIFQEESDRSIKNKTTCKSISYENGKWTAQRIMGYDLDRKGGIKGLPQYFDKKEINITETPNEIILKKSIFSQFASLKSLKREITRLKEIKAYTLLSNIIIDYHRKLAEPFSHIFLIIGILPLALEIKKRKAALSSLGLGFIFGFLYYTFNSFAVALGKAGILLPILSAWVIPLFFLTAGITGLILLK